MIQQTFPTSVTGVSAASSVAPTFLNVIGGKNLTHGLWAAGGSQVAACQEHLVHLPVPPVISIHAFVTLNPTIGSSLTLSGGAHIGGIAENRPISIGR